MEQPNPLRKKIIIAGGALVFALVIWLLTLIGTNAGKTTIDIRISPMDSKLTIDGKPAKSGKTSIAKGKHTLVATREHFDKATLEVDTAKLNNDKEVFVVLTPKDDIGRAYLNNSNTEIMLREAASGTEFSATQEAVLDNYPFVTDLPYETLDYKIDYDVTGERSIKLVITLYVPNAVTPGTPEYDTQLNQLKTSALSYLVRKDVDPSKIEIEYITP